VSQGPCKTISPLPIDVLVRTGIHAKRIHKYCVTGIAFSVFGSEISADRNILKLYFHAVVVTIDVGFGCVTDSDGHFKLVIATPHDVGPKLHSLHFTGARTECSWSAGSSSVLWYWLPTAEVPLCVCSRAVSVPQSLKSAGAHLQISSKAAVGIVINFSGTASRLLILPSI
jgi:hypothetical protein